MGGSRAQWKKMSYAEAVDILKSAVKESHLEDRPHIDLSVVSVQEREKTQKALMWVRTYMARGEVSEAQIKRDLGL